MIAAEPGNGAMEQDVLRRLRPLIDGGRVEPAMFFRVCALMGISFAAAMATALSSPAFAKTIAAASSAPSSYADFVGPDVLAYIDATATTNRSNDDPNPFDDHYFVQKSGEPFSKFDKAPDPFSKSI
jgi:hypothetical protein